MLLPSVRNFCEVEISNFKQFPLSLPPLMRNTYLILIFSLLCTAVSAQTSLTSSSSLSSDQYDRNGNPIDSTAVNDASTVPIGLYSWTIDERLGTKFETEVDTLHFGFQNSNDTGGPTGHYSYLGNLGSPRISHVYFEREDYSQGFFTDPYSFTFINPERVVFTNTKSPFSNLTYFKQGNSRYGEERFKAYYAVNALTNMGFGANVDYVYGRGQYQDQSTALFCGDLYAYYHGDNYEMHASFIYNNLKMAENGGITDDNYVKNPLDMAEGKKTYRSSEIPTNLTDIWNHNTGMQFFLTHRYNLGFYKDIPPVDENDTIPKREFLPVTSFIHTLKVDMNKRKYVSYDTDQNDEYFNNNFFGTDSLDIIEHTFIKNTFGISLREGFNKYAKAGLTAFISHEYRSFTMNDSTTTKKGVRTKSTYKENVVSVGGQLLKEQGNTLHYNVIGELAIAGEDAGQFSIEGTGDLNFRLFKDTVHFQVNAFIKNQNPIFYFRHLHSKHYWWDNEDLSKVSRYRVEGTLTIDHTKTQLKAGIENIKNYTYLENTSVLVTEATDDTDAVYANDAAVKQHSGNIQILSASLKQDFKLGILHLDNLITFQKSSNEDVLPLPKITAYHNLYLSVGLAKRVLKLNMGIDLRYFSEYYAPDYSVAMGQFYLQNQETRYKLGGFPLANAYINFHLKRTRFFIMMYNVLKPTGDKSYFSIAHYPLNPRILKFGLSWNFFD